MDEANERPGRRRRRWPFYLLLTLAAVSLLLHATQYLRGKEIAERQRTVLRSWCAPGRSRRPRRGAPASISAVIFSAFPRLFPTPLPISSAASTAVAPPLRLLAVQVDPGLHDLGFELTVAAAGSRPRTARRAASPFFLNELRDVPGVTLADLSGPGPTARGRSARVFTVNGQAELQP